MHNDSQYSNVVARRVLALPDDTVPVGRRRGATPNYEETAHLHCNERSGAQVSVKSKGASQRHTGIVYIVGGGPGDPGLITVKGLDCLRRADVVSYDRLIAQELLNEVPTHAELIDVGKEPKRHRRSQDEINTLLIEKALEGKVVVRLKGGDPFVFGRGGEECQALAEAGIRYEVVPGVSSAIAVPAYAGIPVTQRGVTTAFTVVAGHTGGSESTVDWNAISRIGTIIFLMGVEHLPEIVENLIAHGRGVDTPVALIREGTTQNQLIITGTLTDIIEKTRDIHPPAVLVVGEVVRLHDQLHWFAPQALSIRNMQEALISL